MPSSARSDGNGRRSNDGNDRRSNDGNLVRPPNDMRLRYFLGDNGFGGTSETTAIFNRAVEMTGQAREGETAGRDIIRSILTSGYNLEEQLLQLEHARQIPELRTQDHSLIMAAAADIRRLQRATPVQASIQTMLPTAAPTPAPAPHITTTTNTTQDVVHSRTTGQHMQAFENIRSRISEFLGAAPRETNLNRTSYYETLQLVIELAGSYLQGLDDEDIIQMGISNPETRRHLQEAITEYNQLRLSLDRARELLVQRGAINHNNSQGVARQGGNSRQNIHSPRPQSAPPDSHDNIRHSIELPLRDSIVQIYPYSRSHNELGPRPRPRPPQPPPHDDQCPRAVRGRRRDFLTMSNDWLLQTRHARFLAGLDILDMDEEIAFRARRNPCQWGLLGQLMKLRPWRN